MTKGTPQPEDEQPTQEQIDEHEQNVHIVASGLIPVCALVVAGYGATTVAPALAMMAGSLVADTIAEHHEKNGTPMGRESQVALSQQIAADIQDTYLRHLKQAGVPTFETTDETPQG